MDPTPEQLRQKSVMELQTWADGRGEINIYGRNGSFGLSLGIGQFGPTITLYNLYRQMEGAISLTDDGIFEGWYYDRTAGPPVRRTAITISTRLQPSDTKRTKPKPKKKRRKKVYPCNPHRR